MKTGIRVIIGAGMMWAAGIGTEAAAQMQELVHETFAFDHYWRGWGLDGYIDHPKYESGDVLQSVEEVNRDFHRVAEFSIPQSGSLLLHVLRKEIRNPKVRAADPAAWIEIWDEKGQKWRNAGNPAYVGDAPDQNPAWRRHAGPARFQLVAKAATDYTWLQHFESVIECRVLFRPDINLETKEKAGTIARIIGTGRVYLTDKQGRVLKRLSSGDDVYHGVWIRTDKGVLVQLMVKSPDGDEGRITIQPESCVMLQQPVPEQWPVATMLFGRAVVKNVIEPVGHLINPYSEPIEERQRRFSVETESDVAGGSDDAGLDGAPVRNLDHLSPEDKRKYHEQLAREIRLQNAKVDALRKQVRAAATAATEAGLQNSAAAALQKGCRIETPNARVDSTGGAYGVEYDERGRITRVQVQEGSVDVQAKDPAGGVLPLQAGEQVAVRDQGIDPPEKIPPDDLKQLASEIIAGNGSAATPIE
jgi:hypothetical protein